MLESFSKKHLSTSRVATIKRWRIVIKKIARSIMRYRTAQIGVLILGSMLIIAVFARYIAPYEPTETLRFADGTPKRLQPPSLQHPMGTTHQGQDVFSQWVYASRVPLLVGFISGFIVMVVGSTIGIVSGYYKGTVDLIIMRVVDILYGIPALPLILLMAMLFGSSVWVIILAMAAVLWRNMARIVRSETLSVSERAYVKSARAAGASDGRIMFVHIAPNLLPLIFIETTFAVAAAIILEAGLSFLGVGAELSWGSMLQLTMATGAIRTAWWWMIPPGVSITLLVLSVFYISRAVEEVTNPEIDR